MKKIKLNLDDLKVESFHTTPETGEGREGTVFGLAGGDTIPAPTGQCLTWGDTCEIGCTNEVTCLITCGVTCDDYTCNSCPDPC